MKRQMQWDYPECYDCPADVSAVMDMDTVPGLVLCVECGDKRREFLRLPKKEAK